MRMRMMGIAALIALAAGCAGTGGAGGVSPSASVTTAIQGWEHYFKLDWTAQPKPNGTEIDGYVYNQYGAQAVNVQILAQGLDEGGNLVGQKLEWVQGGVPPMERAFFKVAGLPPAPRYRVAVWAFDWVQAPKMDQ